MKKLITIIALLLVVGSAAPVVLAETSASQSASVETNKLPDVIQMKDPKATAKAIAKKINATVEQETATTIYGDYKVGAGYAWKVKEQEIGGIMESTSHDWLATVYVSDKPQEIRDFVEKVLAFSVDEPLTNLLDAKKTNKKGVYQTKGENYYFAVVRAENGRYLLFLTSDKVLYDKFIENS